MQCTGRLMDWTLEDNMVNCLIFCTTLTSRRSGHTLFVQTTVETSNTCGEAVELDPHCQLRSQEFLFRVDQSPVFRLSPNNWKLVKSASKNLSKFVSERVMTSSASFRLSYCTLFLTVPFQEGGSGRKVRSFVVYSNLSAFHPLLFLSSDELMSCWAAGMKWVSWFEMPCIPTRWTGDPWVEQMTRLHVVAC